MVATDERRELAEPWRNLEPDQIRIVQLSLGHLTDAEIAERLGCRRRQTVGEHKALIVAAVAVGGTWRDVLWLAMRDGVAPDLGNKTDTLHGQNVRLDAQHC